MKTFVIGGAGFLGSHIVDALLQHSHDVTVLSRSPASAVKRLPGAVEIEENYIDPSESQALLGYGGDAIDTAFAETVSSVPEPTLRDGWEKLKAAIKPGPAG